MKSAISLVFLIVLGIGTLGVTGCQSDSSAASNAEYRTRPSVDQEMGGGMNLTGAGADNGSSSSGMDRAGGGVRGTHGNNSGARQAGDVLAPGEGE